MKKLLYFFILCGILSQSCETIEGEGPVVTDTLNIAPFNKAALKGSFDLKVNYGPEQWVYVEGHQNIIERLKREVNNDRWNIELKRGNYRDFELTVYITTNNLEAINLNGSGNIRISKLIEEEFNLGINGSGNTRVTDSLVVTGQADFNISGSGDIDINYLESAGSDITINGSGDVKLNGQTGSSNIRINGSGNISAYNYYSEHCSINVNGSGDCEVNVTNQLTVDIDGSGDVRYKGQPELDVDINGSGSVKDTN